MEDKSYIRNLGESTLSITAYMTGIAKGSFDAFFFGPTYMRKVDEKIRSRRSFAFDEGYINPGLLWREVEEAWGELDELPVPSAGFFMMALAGGFSESSALLAVGTLGGVATGLTFLASKGYEAITENSRNQRLQEKKAEEIRTRLTAQKSLERLTQ